MKIPDNAALIPAAKLCRGDRLLRSDGVVLVLRDVEECSGFIVLRFPGGFSSVARPDSIYARMAMAPSEH